MVAVRQWHGSEGGAGDVMGCAQLGCLWGGGMAAPAASLPPNGGAMGVAVLVAGLGRYDVCVWWGEKQSAVPALSQ